MTLAPSTTPSEHRRPEILRVARRRFMRDGYAQAGMEAVAREASVSTATLYAHFPSKAELFRAVIDDAAHDFARMMASVKSIDGDATHQIRSFALAYARFMSDPFVRSVFRLVMAERPRFAPVAAEFFERGRTDFGGVLMAAIRRLSDEGALKVDKPSWAAGQLMGMIEHPVFFMPLVTGDEVRPQRSIEAIADEAVRTFIARYGVA